MSTSDEQNPFYIRGVVHDLAQFIGRMDAFTFIINQLLKEQCVSIVGKPLVGKSSLLQMLANVALQQRMGYKLSNFVFVILDFADYEQRSKEDFFQDVCRQIMLSYQRETAGFIATADDWGTNFKYLLHHMNGLGFRPVLLMDAFDKITRSQEFDFAFFSYLRNLAGRHLVYYVTASINPLAKVCHPGIKSSTFFGLFIEYPLGPLMQEEAEQLISTPMQGEQHFTTNEMRWIIDQAGRHPHLLQLTCSTLFEEKFQRSDDLNLKKVQERLSRELSPIFATIWSKLNEESFDGSLQVDKSSEQRQLLDEARRGSSLERQRKIPELSESQLLRNYLRERFHIEGPDITFEDLKEVLNNLYDIDFLSTSKLADTQYVSVHYELALTKGPVKKGRIVKALVNKAHTLMSPDDNRSDLAPQWRLYNILYYRYLKHQLDTDLVYSRIGIRSRRDFFRKQNDAIEALLKKVCEIEMATLKGEQI